MMFDYEYYLKNINNYESVINNMHNNLSRSNVDKIQSIKKTLFKFRTAIIDSEFEIFHTNSLLEKINNLLTTITELLNGAYLYRIFTIKNTKYKIGKVSCIWFYKSNEKIIQTIDNIINEKIVNHDNENNIVIESESNCEIVIGNWIENKYLASQQKEMELKNLELLNYEGNPKDTSDEYTDTDFMRKILKCVANS